MADKVHIVGIGGVGMSALAQTLLDQGCTVTGSDRLLDGGDLTETLACLKRQGVALFPQDGSGVTHDTTRLVVSTAIEKDNPDLIAAMAGNTPVVHRAAELARAVSGHKLCAITGTCGKSTVTAMLGHLLAETGFDPLVVNGASVAGWDRQGKRIGSVRDGKGEWAVIEADESDKSLMVFQPDAVVITNASADHFGLDDTENLFDRFVQKTKGPIIDGRQERREANFTSGGFLMAGMSFAVPMPGTHNLANARLAVSMALWLGAPPAALVPALASFRGVSRRLQRVGTCCSAAVIDDYAHNPEKLFAAWTTLAKEGPEGVIGVWRPHGYGPLRKMMDALADTFARVCRPQDTLLLLPVYDAGGTADRSVNSDALAEKLSARNINVRCVPDLDAAEQAMRKAAAPKRVLAVFGARDPGLPRLAARLCREEISQ